MTRGGPRKAGPNKRMGHPSSGIPRRNLGYRPTPEQHAAIMAWLPSDGMRRAELLYRLALEAGAGGGKDEK